MNAKINFMPKQRCQSYLQIYLRSSQEVAGTSELAGRSAVCFQRKAVMTAQKAPAGPPVRERWLTPRGGAGGMKGRLCHRDQPICNWVEQHLGKAPEQSWKAVLEICAICTRIASTWDLNSPMGRETHLDHRH